MGTLKFDGFDSVEYDNLPEHDEDNQEDIIFEPVPNKYTQAQIIEALRVCLQGVSSLIKPTKTLQNMVYFILKTFFIDGKKYVVANCPTGSGKTIIGFMTYFCTQYLYYKFDQEKDNVQARPNFILDSLCYFLTSNKALQNQIQNDIERFDFHKFLFMLKGVSNYPCTKATENFNLEPHETNKFRQKILAQNPKATFASYEHRPCANYSGEQLQKKFPCFGECPYKCARKNASLAACTILNYAYFLNVMRRCDSEFGVYFRRRFLTISDEAHLLPDIICNMFNFEFTCRLPNRIENLFRDSITSFGSKEIKDGQWQSKVRNLQNFFYQEINQPSSILRYLKDLSEIKEYISELKKVYTSSNYNMLFNETITSIIEDIDSLLIQQEQLEELLIQRPEDVFFESEEQQLNFGITRYKHILKDLKEAELVQTHFLSKIKYGLFMSATLGDVDEYATLMGMKENEYSGLMLPSTFDFTNSPIYMCESGYLSYNAFDKNIDKVLLDTIKVCNRHPKEKGLIHTGTFKITNLLKEKILSLGNTIDINRFLFYQDTKEKEMMIETLRNSTYPYILVGPSLYEGIDLPDDKCRFQVLVKVPYAQMSRYIKKKMERYPFWYKRNAVEKVIQAIGRSNRHKNDYSTIYLMDSLFDKIIYDTDDVITSRIEYRKIY